MSDRAEQAIVILILAAAGLVLLAPVLGRNGAPRLADAAMILAAASGVGAFAVAAANTLRSANASRNRNGEDEP